jgi:hypothetical protein
MDESPHSRPSGENTAAPDDQVCHLESERLRLHSQRPYCWIPTLAQIQLEEGHRGSQVPYISPERLISLETETRGLTQLHNTEMSQPLCGDHLVFYARPGSSRHRFTAFFGGSFCSLCKASGSIMLNSFNLLDWNFDASRDLVASVLESVLTSGACSDKDGPLARLSYPKWKDSDLDLLQSLTRFRTRLGCLRLPWKAAESFLVLHAFSQENGSNPRNLGRAQNLWLSPPESDLLPTSPLRTRIAPSPTGHLHLGHGVHLCFVTGVADICRQAQIFYRIEDHDQTRCRPQYVKSIVEDLGWFLGENAPRDVDLSFQSQRLQRYEEILQRLINQGLVYGCLCSRKTLRQRDTHEDSSEDTPEDPPYPGTCRDRNIPLNTPGLCLRLRLPAGPVFFQDLRHGNLVQFPSHQCGDMVIRDRAGHFTYQFAVTVDDMDQGINLIIRGDDLLSSVGRQLMLRHLMGDSTPIWTYHHPLLMDPKTGFKLSKRNESESWESYRNCGMSADDFRGECLFRLGVIPEKIPVTLKDLKSIMGSN